MKNKNIPWSAYGSMSKSSHCGHTIPAYYKLEPVPGYKGVNYRGTQNKTISGRTCQKWTSNYPHKHNRKPGRFRGKGIDNHNYCRNPDGEPTIWCYTTDRNKRWELCRPRYIKVPAKKSNKCGQNGRRAAEKIISANQPEIVNNRDTAKKMFNTLHDQYVTKTHQADTQKELLKKQASILELKKEKIDEQNKLLEKSKNDLHTKRRRLSYDENDSGSNKSFFNILKSLLLISSIIVIYLIYNRIKNTP
tara:strand:+ start:5402 stop:6145 length:744 start_codon:yes stop_codon:yes gene_type:complete